MSPRLIRSLAEFFALRRNTIALLLMAILIGVGERIADRYLPLYLLVLGGGVASIGIFSGANNLVNALYSYFGGYISDRIGHKRALLLFNLMSIAGYTIVLVIPSWQAVIAGSFLFLTWSAISTPATLDLVAQSVPPEKRAMGVSINSLVRRLPMILGPLLGGVLIEKFGQADGIRYSFAIAILLAVVSLFIQQLLIRPDTTFERKEAQPNPFTLWRKMSGALKNLLISDILIRFCEQIPYAFVVIWCVNIVGISALEFGVLTTVEMVTALLVYIPVAHFADKTTKKPFVVATFAFFTAFPIVLLFSQSFVVLVAAFIIRGLKEFGEPTRKSLILDLAPEAQRAGMFGFYYLLRDSIVSVAAFAGAWLWQAAPAINLITACGFGVIGTCWFWLKGKD